jgi:tetratricopeptide (TPR) repeat protein
MTTRDSGRRLRVIASLLGAALLVPSLALPARAAPQGDTDESVDPSVEASERFRRGVKLYKDSDFVAALVEFKRAYELEPNYRVLYNLGQTSSGLKDYAAALQAFEQYLDEGGKEIAAARRKEVEASIEELKSKVGTLTITTNVAGAEIQIDDVVVGVSPLDEPVLVNVGRRRIVATLTGHSPARRVLEVAGTDELDVELELIDLEAAEGAAPTPTPPPKAPAPASESGAPVAGIIALSITGASAIVTGILGGLALSAQSDLDGALAAFPGDPTAIQDAQSKTSTFATATDVMIGVTSALAVTTVVLFIVDPGSGSAAEGSKKGSGGVALSLSPSPTGIWLNGAF